MTRAKADYPKVTLRGNGLTLHMAKDVRVGAPAYMAERLLKQHQEIARQLRPLVKTILRKSWLARQMRP